MEFIENVKEANKAIKDNLLRTSLTAAIVAIGITSLVGILTAIDAIQYSITSGLANLGANSFDIQDLPQRGGRRGGVRIATRRAITFDEAMQFKDRYTYAENISIATMVSGATEIKYFSKKTNPNSVVMGVDEYYLPNKGYDLEKGRAFSSVELKQGLNVAIIAKNTADILFEKEEPVGKEIVFKGNKYQVIGVLKKTGGLNSGQDDRTVLIPLLSAYKFAARQSLYFTLTAKVRDPSQFEYAMGEATGLMRLIRKDALGADNSFEIERSESLASTLDSTSSMLKLGGGLIGFITLLGAAIGLMNIMMVSVTERTKEIGVRKALGATPMRIREQFLMEAIVICLLGGIFGILFGLLIGNLVAIFISEGSFVIPWLWIALGLVVCVVVGVISGYYPARKAAALDPIESLRYE